MGRRVPPCRQDELIGWLASYFQAPADVFKQMTPDKRWTVYQRICDKMLYPSAEAESGRVVYH
jgi:hypothetical protein